MSQKKPLLGRVWDFLGSFGFGIVLLLFLFVLTGLGTWEQRTKSIYDVQHEYFESLVVIPSGIPIPLPGAYLVLALLSVNLIVGGIIRIRKGLSTAGVIIAHLGILTLLAGGFIEYQYSTKGSVMLFPGEEKDVYRSYYDWDIHVIEYLDGDKAREHVIPQERFQGVEAGERVTFQSESLPFDVEVLGYERNAEPMRASPGMGVDGFMIRARKPEKESEANLPAAYVNLVVDGRAIEKALLWGGAIGPVHTESDGRRFGVKLKKRTWTLPFALRLDKFVKEEHPGTAMAREYSSYVRRIENGVATDIHITMNEPMRHAGYTFYQSAFREERNTGRTATILSVVENPADKVPEPATWVIFVGLLLHFSMKLVKHIGNLATRRKRDATS